MSGAASAVVRLYIFRHGVSEWNLLKKWQGVQDTQLAAEGERFINRHNNSNACMNHLDLETRTELR